MHWFLLPFSFMYGSVVELRNKFFDWGWIKSKQYNLPVISVGNISVGGTGKTPHTEYLIRLLLNGDYNVATVSRGYGRKTKGFVEVKATSLEREVGDEPLQIKQKFGKVKVVVDENRVHAIDTLISNRNSLPDVVLLDDAYQHRYVKPGLNILLIDCNRLITNDFVMPAGRLREYAYNSRRADIVIVTKCPDEATPIDFRIKRKELGLFPYQKLFFSSFRYDKLLPVFNRKLQKISLLELRGVTVFVVTGIANPSPLYRLLEERGANIIKLKFVDHYRFKQKDISAIVDKYRQDKSEDKIIVCTEKDAVKLNDFSKSFYKIPVYSIPIKVQFLNNDGQKFDNEVLSFVRSYILKK